jgi:general stress protein YciG
LTLPFPLPLEQARRLVVLATIGVLARSRASACPDCQHMAQWLASRLCLPVPIDFDEARRRLLLTVLHMAGNDRSRAAQLLRVTRRTVYAWCRRYGIPLRRQPTKPVEPAASAPRLRRGLACLPPERRRAIARLGGQRLHALGRAHRFTSEQARAAGSTGGLVVSSDRAHMAELGRKGAASRKARQRGALTPPCGDAQNASGCVGDVEEGRKAGRERRAIGGQCSTAAPERAAEASERPSH